MDKYPPELKKKVTLMSHFTEHLVFSLDHISYSICLSYSLCISNFRTLFTHIFNYSESTAILKAAWCRTVALAFPSTRCRYMSSDGWKLGMRSSLGSATKLCRLFVVLYWQIFYLVIRIDVQSILNMTWHAYTGKFFRQDGTSYVVSEWQNLLQRQTRGTTWFSCDWGRRLF